MAIIATLILEIIVMILLANLIRYFIQMDPQVNASHLLHQVIESLASLLTNRKDYQKEAEIG